jgi:hypothetical protein
MGRFTARIEPVPGGGLYVVVPQRVAAAAGLAHGARVRGEVRGVAYRSSLMIYGGVFHMGVHKATSVAARAAAGDRATFTIERDDAPLPTDTVPPDLARALKGAPGAAAAFKALAPSARREHVKSVLDAKKAETRERRIARIVESLRAGAPQRRTWTRPPGEVDPRFQKVIAAFAGDPQVTSGEMMASVGLKVGGKIFAMVSRGHFVAKLPRPRADELVRSGEAAFFDPRRDGRVMKEWIELKGASPDWLGLAHEARAYVGGSSKRARGA